MSESAPPLLGARVAVRTTLVTALDFFLLFVEDETVDMGDSTTESATSEGSCVYRRQVKDERMSDRV